jgi:hypothetical protein
VQHCSRRLARSVFHQMVKHREQMEKRQIVMTRVVAVGVDLFAMIATLSRTAILAPHRAGLNPPYKSEAGSGQVDTGNAAQLADLFCTTARRRIQENLRGVSLPEDRKGYNVAQELLRGEYAWLEEGIVE